MSACTCGEVELGAVPDRILEPSLEMSGTMHRGNGAPCYRIEESAQIPRGHLPECVCMDCEDRRAGRTIEVGRDTFGPELLAILELGPYTRKITLEAMDEGTLVTVTTEAWLELNADGSRYMLDHLRHYRLVPIEPQELEAP